MNVHLHVDAYDGTRYRLNPLNPFNPRATDFANTTLRSRLLSGEVLSLGGLTDGLGLWLFSMEVSAAAAGGGEINAKQLADGLVRLNILRGIAALGQFLRRARPALADLALYGRVKATKES